MDKQSTDSANSAPLITAKGAGDDLKQIASRSSQDIAGDDPAAAGKGGTEDAVTAPIPGNA